jgi:formyl-CoA transferase
LNGVRVLDVATLYPAPLLAAMLGDYGADVVKIEPRGGDPLRAIGDAPWTVAGRNKRSVQVDVDTDDGLALLQRLTGVADVIVFNQPHHVLARWTCSDDDIAERNPRAVIVHMSAFGSSGPYADRVGNGSLAEAFVGLVPGVSVPMGDTLGALSGVIGVLLALHQRRDRGQVVDVSLYESLLPLLGPALAGATSVSSVREIVRAPDGRSVMIAATTAPQLRRLGEVVGSDLSAWIEGRTAERAVADLVDARIPAVIVNDLEHLRADPHVIQRKSISAPARPAPGLGDHTDEVVEEWLGGRS